MLSPRQEVPRPKTKVPVTSLFVCRDMGDSSLAKVLRRSGRYYQSGEFFYHRLWHQYLTQIGFRVISVTKLPYHQIWDVRCYGALSAQSYLLLSVAISKQLFCAGDIVLKQLPSEIRRIAKDLGAPIRRDCIHVGRKGAYMRISFIWPLGKPGRWVKPENEAKAFSFLIRPWLRRNRN